MNTYDILPYTIDDVEETQKMWVKVWRETYPNEEHGVSKEWVEKRLQERSTKEALEKIRQRIIAQKDDPNYFSRIAKDSSGKVVGMILGQIDENGNQRLGALYTASETHGTGLAQKMAEQFFDWTDNSKPVYVGVAKYNGRAKRFYEKIGFKEIPDSEHLFDNVIPEIVLVKNP